MASFIFERPKNAMEHKVVLNIVRHVRRVAIGKRLIFENFSLLATYQMI